MFSRIFIWRKSISFPKKNPEFFSSFFRKKSTKFTQPSSQQFSRPFERTLTLHKDSTGHVGFQFKLSKITAIVVDSSAARNGLLIDHNLLEVNGQNVVGMKDREITKIIDEAGQIVTITVIPNFLYRHMMKNMSTSLVKKMMDHSVTDI